MLVHRLEPRRLFAITISVDTAQNVTIAGTDGDDVIWIDNADESGLIEVRDSTDYRGPPVGYIERENTRSLVVLGNGGDDNISFGDAVEFQYGSGEPLQNAPVKVFGGDGNDTIYGLAFHDSLYGGNGNDTLRNATHYYGESGNDFIQGRVGEGGDARDEYMDGGSGRDTILTEGGNDTVFGGSGNDLIRAGDAYYAREPGIATVDAGTGHDKVYIAAPANVDLGTGDDKAYVVYGPRNAMSLTYHLIHGTINGGDGKDYIRIDTDAYVDPDIGIKVYGGNQNDTILGGLLDDSLFGGDGNDYLNARSGNDYVEGNDGNDTILGGNGSDELLGGAGNDRIYGDAGRDTLVGGSGADVLIADDVNLDRLVVDALDDITRRNVWDIVVT